MAIRQSLAAPLLSMLFIAQSCLANPDTATMSPKLCSSDSDCPAGWICNVEVYPCPTNPKAAKCVRKVCVAKATAATTPSEETNLQYKDPARRKAMTLQASPDLNDCKRLGSQGEKGRSKETTHDGD